MWLAIPSIFSQDLHIHYDASSEKIQYIFDGQETSEPRVKKGKVIFLHIENYNNYLYDVEVKADNEALDVVSSNQSVASILSPSSFSPMGLSSFFGGFNSGAGDGFDNLDDIDFDGPGFGEKGEAWQQVSMLKQKFDKVAREMVQTENQLNKVQKGIQKYKEGQEIKHMVLEEVNKIKYNPTLTTEQIKKLTEEYLQKGLEVSSVEEVSLTKLIDQNNQQAHLVEKMDQLEKGHRNYKQKVKEIGGISELLGGFGFADIEFTEFQKTAMDIYENSVVVEKNVAENKEELKKLIQTAKKGELEMLTSMRYEYEAISVNDFSHTYRTEATNDITSLELEFTLKDSLEYTGAKRLIRVSPIKVPVFGGLKINTSVGLSFGQFFDKPQSYFLREDKIQAQSQDSFLPMLTSFFHFYSQAPKSTSLGGALGIGFPLNGADGFQTITFFLGPSLIFGKGQRIVLTGGIMGGRVERLSQGFEVGDSFTSEADIVPVHHPYELGIFLGLSFNLVK
jgi:hypothetical protein